MKSRLIVPAALLVGAAGLAAAGCSSTSSTSGYGSNKPPSRPPSSSAPAPQALTLTTHTLGVGTVIDANGRTVYFDDQDTTAKILCTGGCTAVWAPVSVSGAAPAPVGGVTFSTTTRADGSQQLTADGHPLYTFVRDGDAGDAYGQGAKDSFGGQSFTWHSLMAGSGGGATTPGTPSAPSTPSGGYGGY